LLQVLQPTNNCELSVKQQTNLHRHCLGALGKQEVQRY
jgi:hypothetical protein